MYEGFAINLQIKYFETIYANYSCTKWCYMLFIFPWA